MICLEIFSYSSLYVFMKARIEYVQWVPMYMVLFFHYGIK
jgi:hypothetical protein